MSGAPEIVAIGEPLYELNQRESGGPYWPGYGGDTSNVAVAAARQGARVAFHGATGADPFGDDIRAMWRAEGVDAAAVRTDPAAATGVYFVTHGPAGHEFSYLRAGSAASRLGPADLDRTLVEGARIVHASGISQAIGAGPADLVFAAMRAARAAGRIVSYDTNLRLKLWPLDRARAVIHAAAALADILRPSLEDARALTGLADPDAIVDFYLRLGPRIVALAMGGEGALVATAGDRRRIAPHKARVVDATGAGDTFTGAFLADYLRSGDPFAAGAYANVAAALATEGYGAIAPMPHRVAVEAALKARV